MCTLVAAVGQFASWPVLVAANRDEHLERSSSPPLLWPGEVSFVAPRDNVAGGTWLGLNARRLFVAVTNRSGVPKDEGRESRGTLVVESLRHGSAEALHAQLSRLDSARFNAFHLFYADLNGAFVTWSDGARVSQERLRPGLHIITERSLGGDDRARTEGIRSAWEGVPTVESLGRMMRHHRNDDPLGSVCVHAPSWKYGTRSSALLFLGPTWDATRLLYAGGAPCQHEYDEQSQLIGVLAGGAI